MVSKCMLSALAVAAALAPGMFTQVADAQQGNIGIRVELSQPSQSSPAAAQSTQSTTDFTMRPSVTSSTLGAGVQTLPLTVFCINLLTGQIINNCNVNLTAKPESFSGGHDHDDSNRPKGSFQPSSGNTGTSGLPTTYTAPEVSGIIDATITGTAPDGTALVPTTATIGVEIDGLVALGTGTNYDLVGSTSLHSDNHYGTPSLNGSLVNLADSYGGVFPNERLAYNDMSLVTGGLFDYQGTWSKPHVSHRFGVDADMRLVPVAERRRVRQLIYASGFSKIIVEGNHWHLRQ
jgi:hypothetical protein